MLRRPSIVWLVVFVSMTGVLRGQVTREYLEVFSPVIEVVHLTVARGSIYVQHTESGQPLAVEVRLSWFDQALAKLEEPSERAAAEERAKARAERMFKRLRPRFESEGNGLSVEVRDPHPVVFDFDPTLQVTVELTVRVPEGARVEVRGVDTGVIIEQNYVGDLDLRTDQGTYFVHSVSGDFVASTGAGAVTVGAVGGSAEIFSRSGVVVAGRLHGASQLETSTGSIEVMHAYDRLKLRGDYADLRVGIINPTPQAVDVETSVGRIVLTVDTDVATTIDAAAGVLGTVRMRNLPVEVKRGGAGRSSLLAELNGGGDVVRLRTRGGEIVLVGRVPMEGGALSFKPGSGLARS